MNKEAILKALEQAASLLDGLTIAAKDARCVLQIRAILEAVGHEVVKDNGKGGE